MLQLSDTADLAFLCSAAVLGLWFSWGQQVSIAGYILYEVHEGSTGVRTGSDMDHITGAAQLESGLRLSPKRQRK